MNPEQNKALIRYFYEEVWIIRIANGKVVEIWNHRDDLGVMQQLGAPIYAGARD